MYCGNAFSIILYHRYPRIPLVPQPRQEANGKILFIDARQMGTMVTRKLRELTEEDIQRIAKTYNDFQAGVLEDEKDIVQQLPLMK